MNTAQLVVIWYAALIISGILLSQDYSYNPGYSVAAVVTLAATVLYTLKKHEYARKGWVLFWVGSPFLIAILSVVGWFKYEEYLEWKKTQAIKPQEVVLSNVFMRWGEQQSPTWLKGKTCKVAFHDELLRKPPAVKDQRPAVRGCLQNKSQTFYLHGADFEVRFDGGDETVSELLHIDIEVPPGEIKEFYIELERKFAYMFPLTEMSYKVLETRASSAGLK